MSNRILSAARILILILILPLLTIILTPPSKINAQCSQGQQIMVDNGLISSTGEDISQFGQFGPTPNISCITGQPAKIPEWSIQTYDKMVKDYYDQARSSFVKNPLSGNQTQSSPSAVINLYSLGN